MSEPKQSEKPLHVQASEILGSIKNKDYGLAETKAEILWKVLVEEGVI